MGTSSDMTEALDAMRGECRSKCNVKEVCKYAVAKAEEAGCSYGGSWGKRWLLLTDFCYSKEVFLKMVDAAVNRMEDNGLPNAEAVHVAAYHPCIGPEHEETVVKEKDSRSGLVTHVALTRNFEDLQTHIMRSPRHVIVAVHDFSILMDVCHTIHASYIFNGGWPTTLTIVCGHNMVSEWMRQGIALHPYFDLRVQLHADILWDTIEDDLNERRAEVQRAREEEKRKEREADERMKSFPTIAETPWFGRWIDPKRAVPDVKKLSTHEDSQPDRLEEKKEEAGTEAPKAPMNLPRVAEQAKPFRATRRRVDYDAKRF